MDQVVDWLKSLTYEQSAMLIVWIGILLVKKEAVGITLIILGWLAYFRWI